MGEHHSIVWGLKLNKKEKMSCTIAFFTPETM